MQGEKVLFPSNEIVSSFLSSAVFDSEDLYNRVCDDTHGMILSTYNVDMSALELSVVTNSVDEVNLVLPYYSEVANISAISLSDDDLVNISGGEIIFAILGAIVAGLGWIGGAIGIGSASSAAFIGTAVAVGGISGGIAVAGGGLVGGGTTAIVAGAVVVGVSAGAVAGAGVGAVGVGVGTSK